MATETFGQRLRRIRMDRNISQDQLAEALHTTRQTVSSWENDKTALDCYALQDIQKVLHVFWDELMTDKYLEKTRIQLPAAYSTEKEEEDYVSEGRKRGFEHLHTDISKIRTSGKYLITLDDFKYRYDRNLEASGILALAEEAKNEGFTVLDVSSGTLGIMANSDKEAERLKKFLDSAVGNYFEYEHRPRLMLATDKYGEELHKAMYEITEKAIRAVFDIKTDQYYQIHSREFGTIGYAESIEDAKELAKKLGVKEFKVILRKGNV